MVDTMSVRLADDVVLELYCCVRQAALSLDRGLSAAAWPLLVDYYDQRRRLWLESLVECLEATKTNPRELESANSYRPRNPTLFSMAFAGLTGRFQRSIVLSSDDVHFFVQTLSKLLKLLTATAHPGVDTLIALRLDLSAGETMLHHKARSISGLAHCQNIEHFNQASHLSTHSIASIRSTVNQAGGMASLSPATFVRFLTGRNIDQ